MSLRMFFTCTLFLDSVAFWLVIASYGMLLSDLFFFNEKLAFRGVHSLWKEGEITTAFHCKDSNFSIVYHKRHLQKILSCVWNIHIYLLSPVAFTILMQLPDTINPGTRKLEVNQYLNCSSNCWKLLSLHLTVFMLEHCLSSVCGGR